MGSIISWIKDLWQFLLDEFESRRRFVLSWAGKVVLGLLGLLGLLGVTWLLDQANKFFSKPKGKTLGISTPVLIPSQNTFSSGKVQTVGDYRHDTGIAGTQDKSSPVPSQPNSKRWNEAERKRAQDFMCKLKLYMNIEKCSRGNSKDAGIRWFSVNTVDGTKRYLMLQTEYDRDKTGYLPKPNPSVCWWQHSFDLDRVLKVLKVKENKVPENQRELQLFWNSLVDEFIAKDRQEEFKNTCPAVLFFRIQEDESLSLLPYKQGKKGKKTLAIKDKAMEFWIHPSSNIVRVVKQGIQLTDNKLHEKKTLEVDSLALLLADYTIEASKNCNSFANPTIQLKFEVCAINIQTVKQEEGEERMKVSGNVEAAEETENSVHIPYSFPDHPIRFLTFDNMWSWMCNEKKNLCKENQKKIDRLCRQKERVRTQYTNILQDMLT